MLTELLIKNVAIIDQLRIRFGPGLTVLSGETGAGKSIIIDALSLLCGGRAAQELIRTGTDEAQVEGIFDVTLLPELQRWLEEAGFDASEELVVKRRLSRVGHRLRRVLHPARRLRVVAAVWFRFDQRGPNRHLVRVHRRELALHRSEHPGHHVRAVHHDAGR